MSSEGIKFVNCQYCPCNESCGDSCRLGYKIEMWGHHPTGSGVWLGEVSLDCGLEVIKHKNGEFRPEWIEGHAEA